MNPFLSPKVHPRRNQVLHHQLLGFLIGLCLFRVLSRQIGMLVPFLLFVFAVTNLLVGFLFVFASRLPFHLYKGRPTSCMVAEMNDKLRLRTLPFRLCSNPKPQIRFDLVGFTNPVRSLRDSSVNFHIRSSVAFSSHFHRTNDCRRSSLSNGVHFPPINDADDLIKSSSCQGSFLDNLHNSIEQRRMFKGAGRGHGPPSKF